MDDNIDQQVNYKIGIDLTDYLPPCSVQGSFKHPSFDGRPLAKENEYLTVCTVDSYLHVQEVSPDVLVWTCFLIFLTHYSLEQQSSLPIQDLESSLSWAECANVRGLKTKRNPDKEQQPSLQEKRLSQEKLHWLDPVYQGSPKTEHLMWADHHSFLSSFTIRLCLFDADTSPPHTHTFKCLQPVYLEVHILSTFKRMDENRRRSRS